MCRFERSRLINNLDDCVRPRVNEHRVAVDDRVSVLPGPRIFRRHFVISHAAIREHGTDTKFIAIFVRGVMTLGDIAVEPGTIIDTQYAVHAADDAADDAANNRSDGTGIVLTDAGAMSRAIRYALSIRSGRHCECYGANEYNVSNHVSLKFGGECVPTTRRNGMRSVLLRSQ